jgi:hypothetical protein
MTGHQKRSRSVLILRKQPIRNAISNALAPLHAIPRHRPAVDGEPIRQVGVPRSALGFRDRADLGAIRRDDGTRS